MVAFLTVINKGRKKQMKRGLTPEGIGGGKGAIVELADQDQGIGPVELGTALGEKSEAVRLNGGHDGEIVALDVGL